MGTSARDSTVDAFLSDQNCAQHLVTCQHWQQRASQLGRIFHPRKMIKGRNDVGCRLLVLRVVQAVLRENDPRW